MARSIKLLNNDYIDTEGVAYNPPNGNHLKLTDCITKLGHNYYDSNADRNDIYARIDAMLHAINVSIPYNIASGVFVIRYVGGYYYSYVFTYANDNVTVMEIVFGGDTINFFSGTSTALNLKKSI